MKKEHPQPFIVRLYKDQRAGIKRAAKRYKCSNAKIIRDAVYEFLLATGNS